ncbi:ABC transporter ATP-binding protein [Celeribacter sp.]|uniref:ABC transporter ATP-binding protein n=1 Tax=Celeribacter sp. TaxID=1890673 RepID=UPI003A9045F6
MTNVLEARGLTRHFRLGAGTFGRDRGTVKAVDDISFDLARGETLALVGESGCGKSTLARVLMRLLTPTSGQVLLDDIDLTAQRGRALRQTRQRMQMVFQDPSASLNPKLTAADVVMEPIENFRRFSRAERRETVLDLFDKVGLRPDAIGKYAFEFSGGQKQRLGIARALAVSPSVIIADEPVSALDVSVQAQVINLMKDIQQEMQVAYLFISHDLGIVEHIADRVAVMYLGRIVEIAPKRRLFAAPMHPYTQALINSAPAAHPRARRSHDLLTGEIPSPLNPPSGCPFHTRCPMATDICKAELPRLIDKGDESTVACHNA